MWGVCCRAPSQQHTEAAIAGHVHAYERNYQTLNYTVDGCAPRWITMGDGGNQEGLYR